MYPDKTSPASTARKPCLRYRALWFLAAASLVILALALPFAPVEAHGDHGDHGGGQKADGVSGATTKAATGGSGGSCLDALRPIEVRDGHSSGSITFCLDDVAKYHGHLGPVPVITYRALQVAIAQLWIERPIRDDLEVLTTGPSDCVCDVFELITRAKTRDAFTVNPPTDVEGLRVPGPPLSLSCFRFEVTRKSTGAKVIVQLKEGFIPEEFFTLIRATHGGHGGGKDAKANLQKSKKDVMTRAAMCAIDELFEWTVVPGKANLQ